MGQEVKKRWFWRKKTTKSMLNNEKKGIISKIKSFLRK